MQARDFSTPDSSTWLATFGEAALAPYGAGDQVGMRAGNKTRISATGRMLHLATEPGASIPSVIEGETVQIIFDGALHNRDELNSVFAGRLSHPPADVELVAFAYEAWGNDALHRFKGVFALIIWDRAEDRLLVARDRVGLHPLFYAQAGRKLLLSPAIESLVAHPQVSPELNRLGLVDHLARRWLSSDETYFTQVKRIPPCHRMLVDGHGLRIDRYWNPAPPATASGWVPDDVAQDAFSAALQRAVMRGLPTGKAGISLSGGLDSSSVAMVVAQFCGSRGQDRPLALSLVLPGPDVDEPRAQRTAAGAFELDHVQIPFSETTEREGTLMGALALARTMPTPVSNVLRPALNYLSLEAARRGCEVIFTGDGADEWVGVNQHLARDQLRAFDLSGVYSLWRALSRTFPEEIDSSLRSIVWNWGARPMLRDAWLASPLRGLAQSLGHQPHGARWRRHLARSRPDWLTPDNRLLAQVEQRESEWWERSHEARPKGDFCLQFSRSMLDRPQKMMFHEEGFLLGQRNGVRIAQPFWDSDLIELMMKIRPRVRMQGGFTKSLLREPLVRRYPGFGFDQRKKSYTGNVILGEIAVGALEARRGLGEFRALAGLGLVDPVRIELFLDRALAGTNHNEKIQAWDLLALESWVRARQ